jgi:hypothetical protein
MRARRTTGSRVLLLVQRGCETWARCRSRIDLGASVSCPTTQPQGVVGRSAVTLGQWCVSGDTDGVWLPSYFRDSAPERNRARYYTKRFLTLAAVFVVFVVLGILGLKWWHKHGVSEVWTGAGVFIIWLALRWALRARDQ